MILMMVILCYEGKYVYDDMQYVFVLFYFTSENANVDVLYLNGCDDN